MTESYQKLIAILKEMFQLDQSDLDFGIYRIMNYKRNEIEKFLNEDLLPQVKSELEKYITVEQKGVEKELKELTGKLEDAGVALESSSKYVALKAKLDNGLNVASAENEVYSHLANFFRRYYSEGDFISLRRYKKDVYAMPYEGEEVKLHWANADQYYIKTAEYFRDYSFTTPDDKKVHFKLVDAETEKDNNKVQKGKERRFIIEQDEPLVIENGELFIHFKYVIHEDKQKDLNIQAVEIITQSINNNMELKQFQTLLAIAPTEKNPKRNLIEKYLEDYTSRNTFDYFIHRDLGSFLTRELDFYIKNEVMFLDDLETENELRIEQYISKVKVIKKIGSKIISFLKQIEDFQKKLWLKRKFVVETNYCITLDNIDEEFYPEILNNDMQRQEWVELFHIKDIKDDLTRVGYTEPLTVEFLKQNPYLVLDTSFFSNDFKEQLIASIDNLDEKVNGLLINSDNFQALNLLRTRYERQVDAVYIDPPYNTAHSEILYKNQFKHSSWLSLIANTARIVPTFWKNQFSFGLAIDDYEFVNLAGLLDTFFPNLERNVVVINHHPQGAGGRLSRTHEYYILLSPPNCPPFHGKPLESYQEDRSFMRSGTAENNYRYGRWKSFYALLLDPKTNKIVDVEDPVPLNEEYPIGNTEDGLVRIYPINSKGEERVWRSSYLTGRERAKNGELVISERGTVYQTINHEQKREVLFSNWTDSKFNSGTHGSNLLRDMGLGDNFDYPKSINALETALWAQTYGRNNALILDYFAGSGTTAHATINLNRQDEGNRKYILVEMGKHFDTATKPRVQKAVYSKDWKDGKPVTRKGVSHIFKYIRLESYEDALNNLEIRLTDQQLSLLEKNPDIREQYMLSYMLSNETENSTSLLNIDMFQNPFEYKMKIANGLETQVTAVDLVETFNYLLGIEVIRNERKERYNAIEDKSSNVPGAVKLSSSKDGEYVFKEIEGRTLDGEKVLVIWRTLSDDIVKDNEVLDAYFQKKRYNTQDFEYNRIYVNGDNNLQNLKLDEERWKVVLIEEEFKKLMFEVQDV